MRSEPKDREIEDIEILWTQRGVGVYRDRQIDRQTC